MRKPPRITVRGQTVQGACTPLRKAPLPSRVYPWSTRRPCGPLAFRRVAAGELGQRKVWGVKRGKETIWCPCPFCPLPPGGGNAPPSEGETPPSPGLGTSLASCVRPQERRNRSPSPSEGGKGALSLGGRINHIA